MIPQSRFQRPRPFWSVMGMATSGQVQHRKSAIDGLPVTLCMPRVKSDKSDWFWSQSIVFTKPFKTGMSLNLARGSQFLAHDKGTPGDEVGCFPSIALRIPAVHDFCVISART